MAETESFDRRPIKTRDAQWSQNVASMLVRIGATPNAISVAGMVAGVIAGASLAATPEMRFPAVGFLLAAAAVQVRLMANLFDGMVAIEGGRRSPVGELYNEIPDRVSDAATLLGCGYALGGNVGLGYWATILALLIAYIRAQGRVAGAPQCYLGPMAKQHRMGLVTVACVLSAAASILVPLWSTSPEVSDAGAGPWRLGIMGWALAIIVVGEIVTVFRRLAAISSALREGRE